MMLITSWGTVASTDHRLTTYPGGKLVTDTSTKHVGIRCPDGYALVIYTGLGRIGRLDVSTWIRQVLRGETRTVDSSLIDLREQATLSLGPPAMQSKVPHIFLVAAYLPAATWAVQIRNDVYPEDLDRRGIQAAFNTVGREVTTEPVLLARGSGVDAITSKDVALLTELVTRRPRRLRELKQLFADINRRAAESKHPASRTISSSCTVTYIPPNGEAVESTMYGIGEDHAEKPVTYSLVAFGVDMNEIAAPAQEIFRQFKSGATDVDDSLQRYEPSVRPRGRKGKSS